MEAVSPPLQQLGERCGDQLWAVQGYALQPQWPHNPPYTRFLSLAQFVAGCAGQWGAGAERRAALLRPAAQVAARPCCAGSEGGRCRAPPGRHAHLAVSVVVEDVEEACEENDPRRVKLEQDFWGLWDRFCSAAAAAGRLRTLDFSFWGCNTPVLMRGLAQLRSLRKLVVWLRYVPHNDAAELARLSSLSALTGLWMRMGESQTSLQTLRLPPQLSALSRLEHLTGEAVRCPCLPTQARLRPAWAAPHALWRRACPPPPPSPTPCSRHRLY